MKVIKYIISGALIIIAIGELLPIYLITLSLLNETTVEDRDYFIGRLFLHIFYFLTSLLIAFKLYASNKAKNVTGESNV